MAQRDYVSRGRAPQNNKNRKKKPPNKRDAGPPSVPWVKVVIVFALLIGFGVFLWSIKDNAEPQADGPVSVLPTPTPKEELPELPEEEWEYIKTLPGYEVEVEVAEREKSDKLYLLQCGSFRTRSQAEEMKANIAFQGLEAQIRPSSGSNGDWFRVILGPLQSKRDAEAAKHTLRKINITTCMILYWNL
ncbi:cell division protein FtsN [Alteromonas pelagimontana]|uniref:Cell division protein FtsN n=1 Tax=Alteromonas pelagimontana TaxID=1858656 RepID=A0A6M4MEE8_9ALTE|nr:SPOR domain-containing protein [Alteromonas pelagimontana]QJR81463.1 cell division protein FtsN [Alteromonas pelagimontana]